MEIKEAKTDEEILSCWKVALELRPHLKYEEFLSKVRVQQTEGYHLMYISGSMPSGENIATSMVGFRTMNFLFCGKTLYIDDVSTLPEVRGQGQAGALLDWVIKYAKDNDYANISLDSGHTRHTAHRLYFNKGFTMNCHHFVIKLKEP